MNDENCDYWLIRMATVMTMITEWIDSDGDGVGNNADAYPADPDRSQGDQNQNNAENTKPHGDSEQTKESASWVE